MFDFRKILMALAVAATGSSSFAAETPAAEATEFQVTANRKPASCVPLALARPAEDVTIGFSPRGKAAAEARESLLANEFFRKTVDGDAQAAERWQKLPLLERVAALARASDNAHRPLRKRALEELTALSEDGLNDEARGLQRQALAQACVRESIDELRKLALHGWQALARRDGRKALDEMAAGLDLDSPVEKNRALKALQALGGREVVEVLITKIEMRWGKFPRSHLFIGTQRSYISDYDVSGSAYDPVVRSILAGTVLDVQILEVVITKYIIEELRRLGAEDGVLKDPRQWKEFLKKSEGRK